MFKKSKQHQTLPQTHISVFHFIFIKQTFPILHSAHFECLIYLTNAVQLLVANELNNAHQTLLRQAEKRIFAHLAHIRLVPEIQKTKKNKTLSMCFES